MSPVVSAQKVVGGGGGAVRSFSSSMLILRDYHLSPSKTDSKVRGYDSAVSRDRVVEI